MKISNGDEIQSSSVKEFDLVASISKFLLHSLVLARILYVLWTAFRYNSNLISELISRAFIIVITWEVSGEKLLMSLCTYWTAQSETLKRQALVKQSSSQMCRWNQLCARKVLTLYLSITQHYLVEHFSSGMTSFQEIIHVTQS